MTYIGKKGGSIKATEAPRNIDVDHY